MSFCSQALIGFCKAETGLSKDVGVALSMGQGEPVPIQPWTLPPTHPLSRIPARGSQPHELGEARIPCVKRRRVRPRGPFGTNPGSPDVSMTQSTRSNF